MTLFGDHPLWSATEPKPRKRHDVNTDACCDVWSKWYRKSADWQIAHKLCHSSTPFTAAVLSDLIGLSGLDAHRLLRKLVVMKWCRALEYRGDSVYMVHGEFRTKRAIK